MNPKNYRQSVGYTLAYALTLLLVTSFSQTVSATAVLVYNHYPSNTLNWSVEDSLNVSVNVSCQQSDCGSINVSLLYGQISMVPSSSQGATILVNDGATLSGTADNIGWVNVTDNGNGTATVKLYWYFSSSGTYSANDGVHLKAFYNHSGSWTQVYSQIFHTNVARVGDGYVTAQRTIDAWYTETFDIALNQSGKQNIRAAIIDRGSSTDVMNQNYGCGTCGTAASSGRHFDNADTTFNITSGGILLNATTTPFKTSSNPQYTSLNAEQQTTISWILAPNGVENQTYYLYAIANQTSAPSVNNHSSGWNITLRPTVAPLLNFTYPTPANGTNHTSTTVVVNVSIDEPNLRNLTYNWNGTDYTIYDDSLVLMLNFDNVSALGENYNLSGASILDLSSHGNNATIVNITAWNASGKFGGAIEFDGVNDYLTTEYYGEVKTLSFWFKTKDMNTMKGLFGQRYDSAEESGNWQMHWGNPGNDNKLRIYTYKSGIVGGEIVTSTTFETDRWYHVAVTSEANDVKYYVNGAFDSQNTWMDVVFGGGGNDDRLVIGGSFGNTVLYPFNGTIDEVKVWNRSLTDQEIYQEYASNLRKFNTTQWYFLVNQQKNATAGLDQGNYTYQVFAQDIYENRNQTPQATITITDMLMDSLLLNSSAAGDSTSENITANPVNLVPQDSKVVYNWVKNEALLSIISAPFETGSNNTWTQDLSGRGHTTAFENSVLYNSTGGYDGRGAYQFNGNSGAQIDFGDVNGLDAIQHFTISAWVNYDILGDWDYIFAKGQTSDYTTNAIAMGPSGSGLGENNDIFLRISDGSNTYAYSTSNVLNTGQWHYWTMVYDGTQSTNAEKLRFYLDDSQITMTFVGDIPSQTPSNTHHLTLSGWADNSNYMDGTIDDFFIYNTSFSTEQVQALYHNRTNVIVSQELSEGDRWMACAIPISNTRNGTQTCSNNLTISDTPQINFTYPTPQNGTRQIITSALINISIYEPNFKELIYSWNTTNYTIYDNSLILMYNFDNVTSLGDNNTQAVDLSRYGNNGTITAATWNASGKHGKALSFNGTSSKVVAAQSITLNGSGTMTAWAYATSFPAVNPRIIGTVGNIPAQIWLTQSTGYKLTGYYPTSGGGDILYSPNAFPLNQWVFVALSFNQTGAWLYINSTLVNSITTAVGNQTFTPQIGWDSAGGIDYWGGAIDEVRIWNRTLTAQEIYQQYISNLQKYNQTTWYLIVNQSRNASSGLADGTYTYQAFAADAYKNNQTPVNTLTVDNAPPTFTNIGNITIYEGQNASIDINATDLSGVDTYTTDNTNRFQINSTGYLNNKIELIPATYWLNISANDTLDNRAYDLMYVNVVTTTTTSTTTTTLSSRVYLNMVSPTSNTNTPYHTYSNVTLQVCCGSPSCGNVNVGLYHTNEDRVLPAISHYDDAGQDLRYCSYSGTSWSCADVKTTGNIGKYTSLALDSDNNPYISYYDVDCLGYCSKTGSSWSCSNIYCTGSYAGEHTSIALDSNNKPHISFTTRTYYGGDHNINIMYCNKTGSSWTCESVDPSEKYGRYLVDNAIYTSLALDGNNKPHIAYFDAEKGDLMYCSKTGSSWSCATVSSSGIVGMYPSIAIDGNNKPHISYFDYSNNDLEYCEKTGSSWKCTTVATTSNVGEYTSIAIDSNNKPHISYTVWESGDLGYCNKTGSSWTCTTVETTNTVGRYTSLALDRNNNPHISHYDSTNKDLRYCKKSADTWTCSSVDTSGNVGEYTSIFLQGMSSRNNRFEESNLISTTAGTTPFYASGTNNYTVSLGAGQCQNLTWQIYATASLNTTIEFHGYANMTTDGSKYKQSNHWNATISETVRPSLKYYGSNMGSGNYSRDYILAYVYASDSYLYNTTIYVYDDYGLLYSNTSWATTSYKYQYNYFYNLTDGTYYVNATAYDRFGNLNVSTTNTITLDTTSPTISLTSPDDNQIISGSSSNFTFTVSDNQNTNCTLYTDEEGVVGYVSRQTNDSIPSDSQVTFNVSGLSPRAYTWHINCTDPAGNSQKTTDRTLIVNTQPEITITSPAEDSYAGQMIYIYTAITDPLTEVDTAWYTITNESGNGELLSSGTLTSAGDWGNTWNSSELGEVEYTVKLAVYANNTGGATANKNVTFHLDNVNPTIQYVRPPQSGAYYSSNFNLSIIVQDSTLNYSAFNITLTDIVQYNSTYNDDGVEQTIWNNTVYVSSLDDGIYNITTTAVDLSKNTRTDSAIFTIDKTPPEITVHTPTETYTNQTTTTINITISDNLAAVIACNLSIGSYYKIISCDNDTYCSYTFTGLADATYTYNISCTDNATNNAAYNGTFTVDTTWPQIEFLNNTEYGNLSQNHMAVNISVTDENIDTIILYLYNSTGELINVSIGSSSPFFTNYTELDEGTYYLNTTVNDSVGYINTTETMQAFLDYLYPAVIITINDTELEMGIESVNITWAVSDTTLQYSYMNLTYPSGAPFIDSEDLTGELILTPDNLTDVGVYTISIYAVDGANNTNHTLVEIVVNDTIWPTVELVDPVSGALTQDYIYINASAEDQFLTNLRISLYNSTGDLLYYAENSYSPFLNNFTGIAPGTYYYNATACDTYYCNTTATVEFSAVDITPPEFLDIANLTVEYDEQTSLQINATDEGGIYCFSLNDTDNFQINCTGYLTNNTALDTRLYWLNITVNDTTGNEAYELMWVLVNDTMPPTFTNIGNLTVEYDTNPEIDINATDATGIDCYSVNDTTNFQINCTGYLTNNTNLSVGIYWLNITVNDTYGFEAHDLMWVQLVDTTPPTFTYMANQTIYSTQTLSHDINATDAIGVDCYSVNDTDFQINCTGYLTNTTAMTEGRHWLNITVNDTSGNEAHELMWVNVLYGGCVNLSDNSTYSGRVTNQSTYYNVNDDIILCPDTYPRATTNLRTNADDIIIDCAGATLQGSDTSSYGILIQNHGVTVKNCNINDYQYGVFIQLATGAIVLNNTINSSNYQGINTYYSNHTTLSQNTITNSVNSGIYAQYSNQTTMSSNTIINSGTYGISFYRSNNCTSSENNISTATYGISIYYSNNEVLDGNRIENSTYTIYGYDAMNNNITNNILLSAKTYDIYFKGQSESNLICNNLINSSSAKGFLMPSSRNTFNTSKTSATNIIGGSNIGGNFYANPLGTGFSQTCTDSDGDDICDESLRIHNVFNYDYLPLAMRDTTNPSVMTITSPINNSFINGNVTLMSYAVDDRAISYIIFEYKNQTSDYALLCNTTTNPYSCLWPTREYSNSTEGYDIRATVYDSGGNSLSSQIMHYTIDRSIPYAKDLTVSYPTGQTSIRDGQLVTLKINVSDSEDVGAGINTTWVDLTSLNGSGNTTMNNETGAKITGQWSLWNKTLTVSGATTDSQYARAYVFDAAVPLNNIRQSDQFHILVDNNPPTYDSQSNTDTYDNEEVSISVNCYDNYKLTRALLSTNISGAWTNETATTVNYTAYPAGGSKQVASGTFGYRFYLFDDAGNMNETEVSTFTTMGERPVFTVQLLRPENDNLTSTQDINLSFKYYNGISANCTLYLNGVANETIEDPVNGTEYNLTKTITDGSYSWYFECVQNQTNTTYTSSARSFTVDATAPTVTIGYPTATTYSSEVTNLSFNYEETNPYDCFYTLDAGATNNSIPGCSNMTTVSYSQGSNTIVLYIKDTIGNTGSDTVTFTMDSEDPTTTLNAPDDGAYNDSAHYVNITFNCSAEDTYQLQNISLYITGSDNQTLTHNQTTDISGTSNSTQHVLTLANGNYTWNCLTYDTYGHSGWATSRRLTVNYTVPPDATAPNFTNIGNITVEYGQTLRYTVNASDEYGISCFSVNDTTRFQINCSGHLTNRTGLTVGTYWLNITVNDTSNNRLSQVISITIRDTTPPTVYFISPTTEEGMYSATSITAKAVASDIVAVSSIRIFLYNSGGLIDSRLGNSSMPKVTFTGLSDGTYYLNASANDTSGNTNISTTRQIILHSTPPTITVNSPANNHATAENSFDFNFTAEDTLNISCSLYLDSDTSVLYSINATNASTPSGIDTILFATGLANRTYSWYINCSDSAGNHNSTTTRNLTIDQVPPTITVMTPAEDDFIGYMIYVRTDITDSLAGVDTATYQILNASNQSMILGYGNLTLAADWDSTWNSTELGEITEDAILRVTANDTVNNSVTLDINFTLDNINPSIQFSTPPSYMEYYRQDFTLDVIVQDLNLVYTDYNLTDLAGVSRYANNSGAIAVTQFTWDNTIDLSGVDEGVHNLTIYAEDAATNSRTISKLLTIDRTPPTVSINSPVNNNRSTDMTVNFNWTAVDNLSSQMSCNLTIDARTIKTDMTCLNNTACSHSVAGLTWGTYRWNVTCEDLAGNVNDPETYLFIPDWRDLDGDDVHDYLDTIIGNKDNITNTGLTNFTITVNQSTNITTYNGTTNVLFYNRGNVIVNFTHNFSLSSKLDMRNITIYVGANSILVNFSGQLNQPKTLWIDDNNFTDLCVKDMEISSISQITAACNGAGETNFTECINNPEGVTLNGITCVDEGLRIQVSNLEYSGIMGSIAEETTTTTLPPSGGVGKITLRCGDNKCTKGIGETCSTCPEDCGVCEGADNETYDGGGDDTSQTTTTLITSTTLVGDGEDLTGVTPTTTDKTSTTSKTTQTTLEKTPTTTSKTTTTMGKGGYGTDAAGNKTRQKTGEDEIKQDTPSLLKKYTLIILGITSSTVILALTLIILILLLLLLAKRRKKREKKNGLRSL